MRRDYWRDPCPDFPDLISRFCRLKRSARLCNLDLNPDAAQPLARLMPRLPRPYVQTFQTETLGATHVQTFQTLCPDFPDSNSWRESAIWV